MYDWDGNALIICGKMPFLQIPEHEFFHEIKRDRITSLHGIHALISWAYTRYGYRGLYYRNDDIFSIYRAALVVIWVALQAKYRPQTDESHSRCDRFYVVAALLLDMELKQYEILS